MKRLVGYAILVPVGFVGLLLAASMGCQGPKSAQPEPDSAAVASATEPPFGYAKEWAGEGGADLRSGPGEQHSVVARLAAGEAVYVRAVQTSWREVWLPSMRAWVAREKVTAEPPPGSAARAEWEAHRAEEEAQRKAAESAALAAAAERERAERQIKLLQRKSMETVLRERFLDMGLDIKVDVTGKNSDRLILTYVLFNDVWQHRIRQDGLADELHAMGFERIDLKDSYDYHSYIYWK